MYLIVLPAIFIVCLFLAQFVYERKFQKCFGHLPTLPRLPFVGNMHILFLMNGRGIFKVLNMVSEIMEEKKLPFLGWAGILPVVVLHDINDCKLISNSCIEKPYFYNFAKEWLGDGLVTAPGEIWKRNVKKIAGCFTRSVVDGYQGVFNMQAKKLVEKLKLSGEKPDNVTECVAFTTFEAICHTALGVEHISDSIPIKQYYKAFNRVLELLIQRGTNLFYHPDFIYKRTSHFKETLYNTSIIDGVSDMVLKKRKLERETGKNINISTGTGRPFKAFIDVLLDLNEVDPTFTEYQVKSEVKTIILGGQETVAVTLSMILLMLGSHSKIQEKLFEEMQNVFGNTNRDVTKEDMERMVYTEAIINETLRLFPPIPAVFRLVDKTIELKSCTIPKGTICILNVWASGRSKEVFGQDAASFKPERWIGDSSIAHMAFSVGKRACIGKRYAMSILKTMLAHCVREFKCVSEADKLDFKVDVTLKPIADHLLQLYPRAK